MRRAVGSRSEGFVVVNLSTAWTGGVGQCVQLGDERVGIHRGQFVDDDFVGSVVGVLYE